MSLNTVPGVGDIRVPALMELGVQWENTGCNQIVTKGNISLQYVVFVVKEVNDDTKAYQRAR